MTTKKSSTRKSTLQSAISAYGEPEKMNIGDQTEIDLLAHNLVIPNVGRGRFGNLLAFMEN